MKRSATAGLGSIASDYEVLKNDNQLPGSFQAINNGKMKLLMVTWPNEGCFHLS
jgi:hypothetical protein